MSNTSHAVSGTIAAIVDEHLDCGVTTRAIGDDKEALADAANRDVEAMVTMKQVHGKVIHVIDAQWNATSPTLVGDGLLTRRQDVVLYVRIADCAGVLLWDATTSTIAAVHSGWRGTRENIVGACVHMMRDVFACDPASIRAYISPCASGEKYEVREDVARYFPNHIVQSGTTPNTWLFDNRSAIRSQLLASGITQTHVCIDPSCTISDERFHSYRRDASVAGRCAAFIGLRSFDTLVPQ